MIATWEYAAVHLLVPEHREEHFKYGVAPAHQEVTIKTFLDEVSEEGWELVAVNTEPTDEGGRPIYYLRRAREG